MAEVDGPLNTPAARRITTVLAAVAMVTMPAALIGPLVVQLKADLGLSDSIVGLTLSSYFGSAALTAVIGGRLADRFGWRSALRAASAMSGANLICLSLWARSSASLIAFFVAAGLAHAVAMPASNLALAEESPGRRLGVLLGTKQAAIPVATFLAGLAVAFVAVPLGWPFVFFTAGIAGLCVAVSIPTEPGQSAGRLRGRQTIPFRPRSSLLLVAIAGSMAAMAVQALNAFSVASSVSDGLPLATAAILVALGSVLGVLVRVGGGWAADQRESDGFTHVVGLLLCGAVSLAMLSTSNTTVTAVALPLSYASVWGWPGLFHLGVVQHHSTTAGAATGVVQVGLSAGAALGPIVFGLFLANEGFPATWRFGSLVLLCAATAMAWSAKRLRTA